MTEESGTFTYETREVLEGAYQNRGPGRGRMLTHTLKLRDGKDWTTLCFPRVHPASLADSQANPEGLQVEPTCRTCRARDPRFQK